MSENSPAGVQVTDDTSGSSLLRVCAGAPGGAPADYPGAAQSGSGREKATVPPRRHSPSSGLVTTVVSRFATGNVRRITSLGWSQRGKLPSGPPVRIVWKPSAKLAADAPPGQRVITWSPPVAVTRDEHFRW